MDLLSFPGDRCKFPVEIEVTRNKRPGAWRGSSVLRGHQKISTTPPELRPRRGGEPATPLVWDDVDERPRQIETCGAEFHAVNQANSRLSKDFSVSGVGAIVCHHGLVRKNGVVDLQKGERYVAHPPPPLLYANLDRFVNMDYIFLSTVKDEKVKAIKISYDIACRWSINLFKRVENYSTDLRIPEDRFSFEYFIPKFHLPAHGSSCHTRYSFNYRPGVGRTHGENIESGWAHTNPAAVATREMGAGARHSALDSHWGGWNWRKITGLGEE